MHAGVTIVLGFACSIIISRALASQITELARALGASTGIALLLTALRPLLAGLAMLACYLPGRKATEIDPLRALQ